MTDQNEMIPRHGKENPRRGSGNEHVAAIFIRDNPIGTRLTPAQFDEWAVRQGLLMLPDNVSRQSDFWKAHLHRRHELKTRITRASTTRRMNIPFVIESLGGGQWEVRSPEKAIVLSRVGRRVDTLVQTKRRKLAYLMQSADWLNLPPWERDFAEALYDDIDSYAAITDLHGQDLDRKFDNLRRKLEAYEKSGGKLVNGGIKAITADQDEEEGEETP
jgi:hypothetical protein